MSPDPNLPAIAEIDYDIPLGQGRYHRRKRGQLLHPDREPQSVLEEAKREWAQWRLLLSISNNR